MTEYLSCFKRNILSYCTVLADVLYSVKWTLQYTYKHIVMGYNQDYCAGRQTETVHIIIGYNKDYGVGRQTETVQLSTYYNWLQSRLRCWQTDTDSTCYV